MVQSSLWVTTALLSSLATATEAFHVPFFQPAEEASAHLLSVIYSSPNLEQSSDDIKEVKWACDVRSWVRAPDLRPDTVIPAEARLAVNGSACGDIVGWDVGLRFKERAIVKIKSSNTDFPKRPVQPRMNASMYAELDAQRDWNDVYFVGGPYISPYQEYEEKLEEYNLAMQNQSLWEVKASERIVYDLTQPLHFDPVAWPSEQTSEIDKNTRTGPSERYVYEADSHVDEPLGADPATWGPPLDTDVISQTQSFFVHVPSTNFPPIMSEHWNGMDQGQDEQMINTETMLEYYQLVHLKNGTTLDIPAGRAGFLPDSTPWSQENASETQKTKWPAKVELQSPRLEEYSGPEEEWERYAMEGPECDKDNLAEFEVEVTADDASFKQGQNVTLNVNLTRTGNGTEYPTFFQARLMTARNVTWVYNFISTEDQYRALVESSSGGPGGRGRLRRMSGPGNGKWMKVLQVPSEEELDKRRKEMEDNERGVYYTVNGGWGGRWPLRPEEMGTRYDIEADQGLEKEVYQFQVHVPISPNDFPNFETTFQTLQPVINFNLHTTFLCEPDQPYFDDMVDEDDESEDEDKEWTEYNLPYRRKEEKKLRNGRSLVHYGSIPVHITTSYNSSKSEAGPKSSEQLVHYLDTDASAPALSLSDTPLTSFLKVNQVLAEETPEQLRKTRYHDRGRHGYEPDVRNPGGRWMHAASLWQRKELGKKGKSKAKLDSEADHLADQRQFVVQN
ncbi:hypothetical protein IAT40_004927 [Kwoniella sp. CBS 6097]